MTTAYAWAPITKVEDQNDGTLLVYGPATNTALDRDMQRMDAAWLDQAMPKWMREGGNIREQHDPKRAVGVAIELAKADNGDWMLGAHVVDPIAVTKVRAQVLKGFSIGIRNPHVTLGKADAPGGLIDGGDVIETSLADRPSNPTTLFTLAKADGAGEMEPVEDPELEELEDEAADEAEVEEPTEPAEESAVDEANKADQTLTEIRGLLPELVKTLDALKAVIPATTNAQTVDVTKADTAGTATVDAPDLTKVDTAEIVKAAVAEVSRAYEDRLAAVEAQLTKALEMPVAGGPVATRTASQAAVARANDATALRAQATEYLAKADATSDLTLKKGYQDRAAELTAKAGPER